MIQGNSNVLDFVSKFSFVKSEAGGIHYQRSLKETADCFTVETHSYTLGHRSHNGEMVKTFAQTHKTGTQACNDSLSFSFP